jgi:hypothetical protein
MSREIKARELELHVRQVTSRGHILQDYRYCVWEFSSGIILIEDREKPGYPSYFLSGLDDINRYNHCLRDFGYTGKAKDFSPRELALIIQQSTKTYGYDSAHFKAWELVRLSVRSPR